MTEFRRISKQRRWRISFVVLFLLSIGLFVFFCQKETIGNRHQSNKENQAILHQMKEQSLKMSQTQLKKKIETQKKKNLDQPVKRAGGKKWQIRSDSFRRSLEPL